MLALSRQAHVRSSDMWGKCFPWRLSQLAVRKEPLVGAAVYRVSSTYTNPPCRVNNIHGD